MVFLSQGEKKMRFLHNLYKFLILIVLSSGATSYAIAADTYTLEIVLGTGNCNGSTHTINNLTPGQTVYLDNYFENRDITWPPVCANHYYAGCEDNATGKSHPINLIENFPDRNMTCNAIWRPTLSCSAGTYMPSTDTGTSQCQSCRAGYYCPGIQNVSPEMAEQGITPCPIGSYNNTTGQSECTICPNGYKTQRTQSTTKNSCQEPCENNTDKVSTWETPQFYSSNILYLCKIKECITGYHDEDINNGTVPNQCVANTYSVTYNRNKPSKARHQVQGTTDNSSHVYDTESALTTNGYTLEGWDFRYWNENADGKGRTYFDEQAINNLTTTNGGTVILYAQWKPKETSLSFDKNATDATAGTPESYTAKYDYAMPNTDIKLPTRQGYTFKGYFDAAEGGTQYYNADGTSARTWNKTDESFTLYAQWEQCEAGYYCQGDNSKLSCPTAFTSDGGADDITDCYLNLEIKLIDEFNKDEPDLKLEDLIESGTKIHWQGTTPAT